VLVNNFKLHFGAELCRLLVRSSTYVNIRLHRRLRTLRFLHPNFNLIFVMSSLLFFPACLFNSPNVKQEQEAPTAISDAQVTCANNAQSIEELKTENAKIKGELERLSHLLEQRDLATNKANIAEAQKVQDVNLEQEPSAPLPTPAPVVAEAETKKVETLDIDEQYKLARKNHEHKNYAEAEKYYTGMIGNKSTWFDEKARFFLGKMYADSGDHKKAIITFQEFIDKYPKSKNIANAVYSQADSFMALGQKQEAQVFFKDVMQRFPRTKEASLAKQRLKHL